MQQARRVKGRDPVTATCRIAAARKLGVGGSGPLGSPPDSHPVGLRARRGAGRNLGSQRRRCGSRWLVLAPPRLAPGPAAHFAQRLPRAAAAPAAQKQSPSQGNHRRAPPAPPLAAAALPMLLAPLRSMFPLPRPGAARRARGRASGSRGFLESDSAPRPLPTAAGQGAPSRRWLRTQRKSAPPSPPTAGRPLPPRPLPEPPAVPTASVQGSRRCRVWDYRAEERVRIANETPAAARSPPLRAAANEPRRGGAEGGAAAAAGLAGREAQVSPSAAARAPRFLPRSVNGPGYRPATEAGSGAGLAKTSARPSMRARPAGRSEAKPAPEDADVPAA